MSDKIPLIDAAKEPAEMAVLEDMVGLMRLGLAGMANGAAQADERNDGKGAELMMFQSRTITAAAILAGMTVGHMLTFGAMNEQDKRRASQVLLVNFRNGIKFGRDEAQRAILAQSEPEGRA